jgi:lantibiotic biosynthesis protein
VSTSVTELLSGALADRALAHAESLARDLLEAPSSHPRALAERALVRACLARLHPESDHEARAIEDALAAAEGLDGADLPFWLHGGRVGVAFLVARALEMVGHEEEPAIFEAIDRRLERGFRRSPWRAQFDLISGLVGYGIYALSRSLNDAAEQIVARLVELAEPQSVGFAWRTPPNLMLEERAKENPNGLLDLGVAHGVAGVIAFLAEAEAEGISAAKPVLDGAVEWMLSQRLPREELGCFSSWISAGQTERAARSAWCYGAPGIAATLLRAARHRGEARWEAEAIDIAKSVARRPIADARILDPYLCHGAAGVGHLYARMFVTTGDPELEAIARDQVARSLDLPLDEDRSFLSGRTGLILALFSAAAPITSDWDRLLLLDG